MSAGTAFELSRLGEIFPELSPRPPLAVLGRLLDWDQDIPRGARLDVLRPLVSDPMDIRRRKAQRQKLTSATRNPEHFFAKKYR